MCDCSLYRCIRARVCMCHPPFPQAGWEGDQRARAAPGDTPASPPNPGHLLPARSIGHKSGRPRPPGPRLPAWQPAGGSGGVVRGAGDWLSETENKGIDAGIRPLASHLEAGAKRARALLKHYREGSGMILGENERSRGLERSRHRTALVKP